MCKTSNRLCTWAMQINTVISPQPCHHMYELFWVYIFLIYVFIYFLSQCLFIRFINFVHASLCVFLPFVCMSILTSSRACTYKSLCMSNTWEQNREETVDSHIPRIVKYLKTELIRYTRSRCISPNRSRSKSWFTDADGVGPGLCQDMSMTRIRLIRHKIIHYSSVCMTMDMDMHVGKSVCARVWLSKLTWRGVDIWRITYISRPMMMGYWSRPTPPSTWWVTVCRTHDRNMCVWLLVGCVHNLALTDSPATMTSRRWS